jgi:cold shock protein
MTPRSGFPPRDFVPRSSHDGNSLLSHIGTSCREMPGHAARHDASLDCAIRAPGGLLTRSEHMAQGTVKVVRRRHGIRFQRPGRRTTGVFVHHSAIQADGYRSLQENQRVKYTTVRRPGGPQAERVQPLACSAAPSSPSGPPAAWGVARRNRPSPRAFSQHREPGRTSRQVTGSPWPCTQSRRNPVAAGRPGSIPWRYVLMSDLPGVPLKIVRDQLSAADRQAGWPAGRDHRGAP